MLQELSKEDPNTREIRSTSYQSKKNKLKIENVSKEYYRTEIWEVMSNKKYNSKP